MSTLAWFEVCTLGPVVVHSLGLLLRKRRRLKQEAWKRDERSAAAIAARVEQEREQAKKPVRWPLVDPDRGEVREKGRRES
ncbi:hypothetical protein [Amycolatopsis pigmentata]|uniref:Uncharacterized protein n=1 Tax=Amycolatopsis pigmentata TaxID=450801 RepID=A0ABW5FUV7_9PSEU